MLLTSPVLDVKVTVIPGPDAAFADALVGGASIGVAVEGTLTDHSQFNRATYTDMARIVPPPSSAGMCRERA